MEILMKSMKKAYNIREERMYHKWQNKGAFDTIHAMCTASNTSPSAAIFKKCDEYAKDVLGSKKYSPWLKAYSTLAGTFKEGWIPENYYQKNVVPYLQGDYGQVSFCNAMSRRMLKTDIIPDLVYSVNGLLYTTSMELIKPADLKNYLFENCKKVVYKLDNSLQGKGVFVYDENNFPEESLSFANGVFQSYIVQHPFFNNFCSDGVSTIRLITVVDDELNVQCRAVFLRIPRSGETHVQAATSVKVAVDLGSGELCEKGYLSDWVPFTQHPDSGRSFQYQMIPSFHKCVETAIAYHKKMPFSRVVGWDLILDSMENPIMIEWEGKRNGIKVPEALMGPCFADLGWQNLWKSRFATG